jgi:hypothetical protein
MNYSGVFALSNYVFFFKTLSRRGAFYFYLALFNWDYKVSSFGALNLVFILKLMTPG